MEKLEKAPKRDYGSVLKINRNIEAFNLVRAINDSYEYWDKVKYRKTPKGITPKELWNYAKYVREVNSKSVSFRDHFFNYYLSDTILQHLHEFDMNLGGNLGSQGLIPEDDKHRYLVSSIMEEAIASSQIEGAVTTRKAAKEMLRKSKKPRNKSEQMIVNNYLTIQRILELKDEELNEKKLFEIHKLITEGTLNNDKDAGRYRTSDDVNVVDVIDGEVVYYPPSYKEVPDWMKEFSAFFNDRKKTDFIHPIIKACIIHFMIGYIHPFVDGNGRTARALFYWYLLKKGYWLTEYLSISRLIVKSKNQYAKAYLYTEIDDNDLTYFIHYKLKTMERAYKELKAYIQRKIKEKRKLVDFQRLKDINDRQALVIKWVYDEPDLMITVKELQTRLGISNQTARTDLMGLVKKGYLQQLKLNKKTSVYTKGKKFESLVKSNLGN